MITAGFLKRFTDHRDLDLLKSFGAADTTSSLPAQYIVATNDMPDQNALGLPEACTAFAQLELAKDQTGENYDVVEFYQSTPPGGNSGRAMRDSLGLLVNRGPKTLEGKLHPWKGRYYNIYKQGLLDWYDALKVGLYIVKNEKRACSAAMAWFVEWTYGHVDPSGIVTEPPVYNWTYASAHDAVIAGWTSVGLEYGHPLGAEYLAIKSHQGTHVGDGGWLYFSRPIVNKLFDMYYTEMFTVSQLKPQTFSTVDLSVIECIISYITHLPSFFKSWTGSFN